MLDIEEVRKYSTELTEQISDLTSFSHKLNELLLAIREWSNRGTQEVIAEMRELKDRVYSLEEQLVMKGMPGINQYENDLDNLKVQINSDDWPVATPPDTIPHTEEDKYVRAETILDLMVTEFLDGVRFLDVGCGEGHVAACASKRGVKKAVGYDIEEKWKMADTEALTLTTDFERVKENAPFDIILAYDFIDHIQENDEVHVLQEMKNLLSNSGKIYLRAHPWCSRHGGHLYNKLNKAFIHLVLDESELLRLFGISPEPVTHLTHPAETYHKWFRAAGFVIREESLITHKVEDIFLNPSSALKKRLEHNGIDYANMSIEYIDYVLEVNESTQQIF